MNAQDPRGDSPAPAAAAASAAAAPPRWLSGRKELVMVALLVAVGAVLLAGSATMTVLGEDVPGPRFVPVILGVLVLLAAAALAVDVIRHPETPHDLEEDELAGNFSADMLHDISGLAEPGSPEAPTAVTGAIRAEDVSAAVDGEDPDGEDAAATRNPASDLRTLGLVLVAMIGFVVILPYAGWVLSAAALFWCMCRFLGSRRPILDIGVSLLVSSVVQLIFGGLLGLSLPAIGGSL